ncbi:hypothetical protein BDV97DRAFT_370604 [Delphinella strobiligena]|nr:hypothetical protein BDV97DRAFT_370604 [Delphinella strobiligena]
MSPFNLARLKARVHQAPKTPGVVERDCDGDSDITQTGDEDAIGTLGRWTIARSAMLVVEIAMSMLPILFIVIASLVAYLNGKKTSSMGSTVEGIIQYLPTIFPILFAAIMGKFFKTLALYRAERGILLGNLERLVGCQSLFGAIERQVALRRIDLLGLAIIVTWAMSPVGGQSALRLMSKSPKPVTFNQTLRYLPIEASKTTWLTGEDSASEGWPSFAPIYMAALRTTRTQGDSTMDLWGNVKIPDFESLFSASNTTIEVWHQVDYSKDVSYTSLLGIPVVGIPSSGNTTFNITSRYWTTDCNNVSYIANYSSFWSSTYFSSFFLTTSGNVHLDSYSTGVMSFSITSLLDYLSPSKPVSQSNCTVRPVDVESSVHCQSQTCRVEAMRRLPLPDGRWTFNPLITQNLWLQLPFATIGYKAHSIDGSIEGSTPTEQWIVNPKTDFSGIFSYANLSSLEAHVFSARLQIVYNTFWQATYGMQYLVGNLTEPLDYYDNATGNGALGNIAFNSTQAEVRRFDGDIYKCNWGYFSVVCIASSVLLFAGIASLILKIKTLAPDILGYASTCIRDNPHTSFGQDYYHISHLDGLEQARALQHMAVIIGDVKSHWQVGHVAFTTTDTNPQRLQRGRTYD